MSMWNDACLLLGITHIEPKELFMNAHKITLDYVRTLADEDVMEFISDFRLNLFADEIYVFTPNGDIINLPANATALDFAYEIHTQVGNHASGVKVNEKLIE